LRLLTFGLSLLFFTPTAARAWTYIDFLHPRWLDSFGIELGPTSSHLESLGAGTTESELLRAMDDWLFVTCADVPMTFAGSTATLPAIGDGASVVGFVESGWPHEPTFVGMTTYETMSCPGAGCRMIEADVELNGVNYVWTDVRGSLPQVNARSIMLHELGHVLGLGHSSVELAAMNASYFRGYLLLAADDRDGICTLYPRDELRVCTGLDCPFGQACVDGACSTASLEPCTTAMDCAFDETCNEENGRCLQKAPGSDEIGLPCVTDEDCADGVICEEVKGARICTVPCDGLDPRSCPSGFHCLREATADCDVGLCAVGSMGSGALGTPCEDATDCGSLFCTAGICALPCDVSAPVCVPGYVCHTDLDGGCGACAKPRTIGEPCLDNAQCTSELCLAWGESGICTMLCETDDDCMEPLACLEEEGVRFCLPRPVNSGGCGCQSATPTGAAPWVILGLIVGWVRRRKR
jgi:MYXO-CTERM domain-containing protein